MNQEVKSIRLPETISVRALAAELKVDPTAVISKLIANGVMAHINQNIDYDTAALLAGEFGFDAEPQTTASVRAQKTQVGKTAQERPPVVTIMGHVDHGKTSLLDYIRQSRLAQSESGGITQHISAYQVSFQTSDRRQRFVTFVDTPGHEAFSALRAHGASITDIVVLVVAADDGVKPQTVEAIKHARAANVPIIVAINKIDLPNANPELVKKQLVELDLMPEDWGGKTVTVPLSAKTGQGVDDLLEMIVLTAELMELKADPDTNAEGIVLEANLDQKIGPVATVLIFNGILRTGQVVVAGSTYGRIRSMTDDLGQQIASAGASKPAVISGLRDVAKFGDVLQAVPNEKVAKTMTQAGRVGTKGLRGEDQNLFSIVIKADVGGSLAALEDSIKKLKYKDASVEILGSGIGAVNENDITLAKAAKGAIISFRLSNSKRIIELARKEGVSLQEYWVIYEVLDWLSDNLKRIATPTVVTVELGRLKVLEIFSQSKKESIAGGEVLDGTLKKGAEAVVSRQKEEITKGKIEEIRVGKVAADTVDKGSQCGLRLTGLSASIEKGDIITAVETKKEG